MNITYIIYNLLIICLGDMKWCISVNFAMAEATFCGASAYYGCANALARGSSLMHIGRHCLQAPATMTISEFTIQQLSPEGELILGLNVYIKMIREENVKWQLPPAVAQCLLALEGKKHIKKL